MITHKKKQPKQITNYNSRYINYIIKIINDINKEKLYNTSNKLILWRVTQTVKVM